MSTIAIGGQEEIDLIDLVGLIAFPVAAGFVFGVWTFELSLFGGIGMGDAIFHVGDTAFTYAMALALGAILWIVLTNEINGSDYEDWEYGVIVFAFLSVPAYEFIPAFQDLVAGSDVLALGLWVLVSAAAVYVSYTE